MACKNIKYMYMYLNFGHMARGYSLDFSEGHCLLGTSTAPRDNRHHGNWQLAYCTIREKSKSPHRLQTCTMHLGFSNRKYKYFIVIHLYDCQLYQEPGYNVDEDSLHFVKTKKKEIRLTHNSTKKYNNKSANSHTTKQNHLTRQKKNSIILYQ